MLASSKAAPDSTIQTSTFTAILLVQRSVHRPVVPGVGMLLACSCSRRYSKLNRNASNRSKNLKRNRELQVNKCCFITTVIPKLQNGTLTANLLKISARRVGCCGMKRIIKPDKIDVFFQTVLKLVIRSHLTLDKIFFLQQSG